MRFCEFIRTLYKHFPCSNQGQFVLEVFSALCGETNPAGSNQESGDFRCSAFLPIGLTGYDPTYRKRLYGGSKKYNGLSSPIKAHIQGNKNKETFVAYCDFAISADAFLKLCDDFEIPSLSDRAVVFEALYEQFIEFAISQNDDVNFVIPRIIGKLQSNPPEIPVTIIPEDISPIHPGDDILLLDESPKGCHQVTFYEKFTHQWTIKNTGTVTWIDRFLECTNQSETRIRALDIRVPVPKVAPGDEACLTIPMDARGFEGTFESIWEMKDNTGRLCFPDKNKALKLVATVVNTPSAAVEV